MPRPSERAPARALYRSRQLFGALRPRIDRELRAEAFRLLREAERGLFESMTLRDQQHCLDVYRRLRDQGREDRDLLVAALLHDAGKGRIALWHRVAFVLLEARAPGLLRRLALPAGRQAPSGDGAASPFPWKGKGKGKGWRQALYRCLHHSELGAALAHQAGCSDQVAALIGAAERDEQDERLLALRAADDAV